MAASLLKSASPVRALVKTARRGAAEAFTEGAREALKRATRGESAKIVAFKTGYSERRARDIKRRGGMPGFGGLAAFIAAYPQFAQFVETWARHAQEPDFFEPEVQREYLALLRRMSGGEA